MSKISTSADTKEIALTIYNGGFGAVKESRTIHLDGADFELIFAGEYFVVAEPPIRRPLSHRNAIN